jgi:ribose transport system ATP-binding protein
VTSPSIGPVISVRSVSKWFPGVQALSDISLELGAGEILGLVGQNGAGKSTLIKIMTGAEMPDEGEVVLSSAEAVHQDGGIAAIYQELTIAPNMSAIDNVFLGKPLHRGIFVDGRRMRRAFAGTARLLGARIDPEIRAGELSVAQQQLLEIMRTLVARHRVLIMDEPTASLGAEERRLLYHVVRQLKDQGTAIIYISHDLDEVLTLSNRIAVMRDGRLVATGAAADWTKVRLVEAMIGETPNIVTRPSLPPDRTEALGVAGLRIDADAAPITFSLLKGEVLGLAGLIGAGRTEILSALFGNPPAASGTITIDGHKSAPPRSIRDAIAMGIALIPEDRKLAGLVLDLPVVENMTLSDLAAVARFGFVDPREQSNRAGSIAARLGLSLDRLAMPARTLSGGNQQKVVIGKWLHKTPRILLMDEPTRGIDIGAKAEIFATIRTLTAAGMAVILVSSDLDELVEHCDRILVVARKSIISSLTAAEASIDRILATIFAVEGATA